jgi:trans-aconitate 2-methyltransferase
MNDAWDPEQYSQFAAERARPFHDLLAMVARRPGMRVIDLGCGSGELTRLLHDQLGASETIGIDRSERMFEKTKSQSSDGLRFLRADIESFDPPGKFDLVFSNAALQWVPEPAQTIRKLAGWLTEAGQLAIQVPANDDHATHVVAAELAGKSPYREALTHWRRQFFVLRPQEYATLFHRLGFKSQRVRLEVYGHLLPTREHEIEWVKGTLLTDYQRQLSPELFARFLEDYRLALLPRLEDDRPHFYPFKRTLMWGQK